MENKPYSKVRVRIAPSPTGFVHIGNLRTILYNYLFAKHYDGDFLVRIEDTDQSRYVEGAVENLLNVLNWTDIEYDEGPFLTEGKIAQKGESGPYFQSERLDIYKEHIAHLIDSGKAYYCFCDKIRLDNLREEQAKNNLPPKYDNHCRHLSREEIEKKLNNKAPHVIRFKMPEEKDIVINDEIHGTITVNTKDLDDYVLIKSDGFPTYHFANVIDDHLMKITHVLRGDEWIPSTPKHVLLYEAFGWQPPIFAHLPPLVNKQKKKLSKREASASVHDFMDKGYLPEALINFIALLGWNSGSDQEIFTMHELIKQFNLDRVHKSAAVLDVDKLDWMNGYYLKQLTVEKFMAMALPVLEKAELIALTKKEYKVLETKEKLTYPVLKQIIELEKNRVKKLSDLPEALKYFFVADIDYDVKSLLWKKNTKDSTEKHLSALLNFLSKLKTDDFSVTRLDSLIKNFIQENSFENGDVLWPMRVALSGRQASPGPFEIAAALGKKKTIARIKKAISML
ncbi:MAG TPA: glutamate--tRNA ligase [Candidatus Bipolaricaulota bacterium]|nr:glutamate--tRNA ligase [Candidatus Bipolaricaulota bacterium]